MRNLIDKVLNRRSLGVKILTPQEVEASASEFKYRCSWTCSRCPAQLRIRAREDRNSDKSNYVGLHTLKTILALGKSRDKVGHSIVEHGDLNWNGLAEERGWRVHPKVVCPACQRGLTIAEYKQARREGRL